MIIRDAVTSDLKSIVSIQDSRIAQFDNRDYTNGFLVYRIAEDELNNLIHDENSFLYVCESNAEILGYLAAQVRLDHIFLKHIAKRDHAVAGQVPFLLEEKLFSEAYKRNIPHIMGEIAEINKPGMKFHERLGFYVLSTYFDNVKQIKWNVVCKDVCGMLK